MNDKDKKKKLNEEEETPTNEYRDPSLEYNANTQTLIGSKKKHLVDMDTGESIYVDQITKRVFGTKNFWKCYLMDFLSVLGILDSKQVDIFVYIVEHTNQNDNLFIGTYKKIAKDCKVSEPTISKIMKKLQEANFIEKKQNGVWMLNPNILMRGNDNKRQILLSYYENDEPIDQLAFQRIKTKEIATAPTEYPQEQIKGVRADDTEKRSN